MGFEEYHDPVDAVFQDYKQQTQGKSRGIKKLREQNIPEEELLKQQQLLFDKARSALRNSQQLDTSQEFSSEPMDLSASAHSIVLSKYEQDEPQEIEDDEEEEDMEL